MQLLAGFACYLLALTALIGAGAGALLLLAPEPGGGKALATVAPQASVSPKVAVSQERKAERHLQAAKATNAPARSAMPAGSNGAKPLDARSVDGARRERRAHAKQKSQGRIATGSPAVNPIALGYASAPPSARAAHTQTIFRSNDRAGD